MGANYALTKPRLENNQGGAVGGGWTKREAIGFHFRLRNGNFQQKPFGKERNGQVCGFLFRVLSCGDWKFLWALFDANTGIAGRNNVSFPTY